MGPTELEELIAFVREVTTHFHEPMPDPAPAPVVDVHFFRVVVDEHFDKARFVELLEAAAAKPGEFCEISLDRFRQGPGYIEIGGWIGDQTLALLFMACGQIADVWEVVTPARLGLSGERAELMAGAGYVMVSGYHPETLTVHRANLQATEPT